MIGTKILFSIMLLENIFLFDRLLKIDASAVLFIETHRIIAVFTTCRFSLLIMTSAILR